MDDPGFSQAVAEGRYDRALDIILQDLHVAKTERQHFKIDTGLSTHTDDLHAQSDADTQETSLDPALFMEGKSGACQGVAHELDHLRRFEHDRQRLHAWYSRNSPREAGWSGCDHSILGGADPARAEQDAYDCVVDDALATHAAVYEIAGVLAQVPYSQGPLRDEDRDYLHDHLKLFVDHQAMITDLSNESYYLPEIKAEDTRIFCRGLIYLNQTGGRLPNYEESWKAYCPGVKLGSGRFSEGFPSRH